MRRSRSRTMVAGCLLAALAFTAAPAFAQHGEEPGTEGEAPAEGEHAGEPAAEGEGEHGGEAAAEGEHGGASAHGGAHVPHFNFTHFGGLGPHDPPPFIANIVNFLALAGILYLLARKPLSKFLGDRRREIAEGLAESSRIKSEAQAKHREYKDRLGRLDRELEDLKKEIVAAGEKERDRIVADAEAAAARMRHETEFLVEQEFKQLRIDLRREIAAEAVAAAERVLRERVTADDQRRLADEYSRMADRMLARSTQPSRPTGGPS